MKINSIFFLICVCFFTACNNDPFEEPPTFGALYEVRFRIDLKPEITGFQYTKSIPQNYPPEPVPVKSENEPGNEPGNEEEDNNPSFSFIEYAVYDAAADTLVRYTRFSEDDKQLDDFGTFIYDTLRAGDYKVCLLSHSIKEATLSGNKLTFPDINDTFYGSEQVSVNASTAGQEKEIVLKRVVSRIEFVATDPVPEKVKTYHLSVAERFNTINLFTGEAGEKTVSHELNHTFTAEERGENTFNTHAFYTFVPSGENTKLPQVSLIAKDASNENVRERIVKDIPIIANTITRYKGILYTPGIIDDRFDLIFDNDGKWNDPIEEDLPDTY